MRLESLKQQLAEHSALCVGIDPDMQKMPAHLLGQEDGLFGFCSEIIKETSPYCSAYKPNLAFFETFGSVGWKCLERLMELMPKSHFLIADAKRGDIGNTAKQYAKAFFETLDFDAITISPYMGMDAIKPFLEYENKFPIVLLATSNPSAAIIQNHSEKNQFLYEKVLEECLKLDGSERLMFVVGATVPNAIEEVQQLAPDNILLIPGIGAQGGDLKKTLKAANAIRGNAIINSSRGIIYASAGHDFANAAAFAAKTIQEEIKQELKKL